MSGHVFSAVGRPQGAHCIYCAVKFPDYGPCLPAEVRVVDPQTGGAKGSKPERIDQRVCEHGNLARKCELCERDETIAHLSSRLTAAECSLNQRYALRRELEAALGITSEMASDDALRAGLDAIRAKDAALAAAEQERDEAQKQLLELEWSDAGRLHPAHWCPVCGRGRQQGHNPECRLSALITNQKT